MAIDRLDLLYMVLSRMQASLLAGDALSRRTLQDMVYISQAWGLPLDYEFTYSLKGPYSNELAPDIMTVQQKRGSFERRTRDLKLKPDAEALLVTLVAFVTPLMEDRRRLHMVSSVMFLGHRYNMNRREIIEYYTRFNPEYFPFEVSDVIDQVNAETRVKIR
ncbi:MAG: hypothetical protein JSW25_07170 [Thermoplasmata archaeon]|nr:MAG: hypothetical protein JSW25_07170 [Thermoplasmata archaeon]